MIERNSSSDDKASLVDALGRLFMRLQDVTQLHDEVVGEVHGLNAAERHCLSFLWAGPQNAGVIAREIRLTPAAVTALLDRLEARGYVRRLPDPADRRRVIVEISDKTRQLTEDAYMPLARGGAALMAGYGVDELRSMRRLLDQCIELQLAETDRFLARHRSDKPPR